jgi:hypothetical protein
VTYPGLTSPPAFARRRPARRDRGSAVVHAATALVVLIGFLRACTDGRCGRTHGCVADVYEPDTNLVIEEIADLLGPTVAKSIIWKVGAGMHGDRGLPATSEALTSQAVWQIQ